MTLEEFNLYFLDKNKESNDWYWEYIQLTESYGIPVRLYKQDKNKEYNFISYNKSEISEQYFKKIRQPIWDPNYELANKPYGGFWASTYTPNLIFSSSWEEYLVKNGKGIGDRQVNECKEGVLFNLKDNTKILRLDCVEDLEHLTNHLGLAKETYEEHAKMILRGDIKYSDTAYSHDQIMERANKLQHYQDIYPKQLNYYLLSNYFDGIYLSKKGAKKLTKYAYYSSYNPNASYCSWMKNDLDKQYNLEYWDIESLLLFNIDCIDLVNQKTIQNKNINDYLHNPKSYYR